MLSGGLSRYRSVLSLPGARGPVAASILGSLPIGMFGLAILLLTREATGSYALAGRVAGAFGLANAIGAVMQGPLRACRTAATWPSGRNLTHRRRSHRRPPRRRTPG